MFEFILLVLVVAAAVSVLVCAVIAAIALTVAALGHLAGWLHDRRCPHRHAGVHQEH